MMLLLHSMQSNVADGCFVYSSKSRTPVHRGGAVSRIISVISRYIHTSSNYMRSIQETARFCNPSRDFGAGTLARGNTYEKKFAYTRLSLSLSLSLSSTGRESERGEVGGSWTLVGSNHPRATIPGRRVPYHLGLPYQSDVCLIATGRVPACRRHPAGGNKAHVGPVWCNAAIRRARRHQAGVNNIRVEPVWCNAAFRRALSSRAPCPTTRIAIFGRPYPVPLADQPPSIAFHLSYVVRPHSPNGPPYITCATDSRSLLRRPPPVAIDISSKFDTLYIYSLSTTYSIVPCSLRHFTGMRARSSNPNIQVSNIAY
jgi:hypothetical protein